MWKEGPRAKFFLGIKKIKIGLVLLGSLRDHFFFIQRLAVSIISMVWVIRKGKKDEQQGCSCCLPKQDRE